MTIFLLVDLLNTDMFLGGLFYSTLLVDPEWNSKLLIA